MCGESSSTAGLDGEWSPGLHEVPSLPGSVVQMIIKKVRKAKRKPEPAAEVVKHLTYLRLVSRSWRGFFKETPVDLIFKRPISAEQLEWLAANYCPPFRSLSFKIRRSDLQALDGSQPDALVDTILQHCASSLQYMQNLVLTSRVRLCFEPLTKLPKLRELVLLCPAPRICAIVPHAWDEKFYARVDHSKLWPVAAWLTLRRWPHEGTQAHQRARGYHSSALEFIKGLGMHKYEDDDSAGSEGNTSDELFGC